MTESRVDRAATLVAQSIDFTYPNGTRVSEYWSAGFRRYSMTALTGPSGSGKSTLLCLLGLMHRPTRGDVVVEGESTSPLRDVQRAHLRAHRFGFVFQDAALDPSRTVIDNVIESALYRGEPRRDALRVAAQLMTQFGVELRADHKPGQVSGGQAQRIALCRALLGTPRFILADEPTGNLDPTTRDLVVSALRQRADEGACVVIATHDPIVAAACNEIVELEAAP